MVADGSRFGSPFTVPPDQCLAYPLRCSPHLFLLEPSRSFYAIFACSNSAVVQLSNGDRPGH